MHMTNYHQNCVCVCACVCMLEEGGCETMNIVDVALSVGYTPPTIFFSGLLTQKLLAASNGELYTAM